MSDIYQAPLLHLHAQAQNHDDAYIVGTKAGLIELRAAIDAALVGGRGEASPTVADGEGFSLHVMLSPSWAEMNKLAYPYTDQIGQDGLILTWLVGGDVHPSYLVVE